MTDAVWKKSVEKRACHKNENRYDREFEETLILQRRNPDESFCIFIRIFMKKDDYQDISQNTYGYFT